MDKMASKRKCCECKNRMHWALPVSVNDTNYEYAKMCYRMGKHTFVCGITNKTKSVRHQQYCNHFIKRDEESSSWDSCEDETYNNDLEKLKGMIKKYEEGINEKQI